MNVYISYQSLLPESYNRADHLICVVECHGKKLSLNPSSQRLKPRAVSGFVMLVPVISLLKLRNFYLCTILLSCLVSELQKTSLSGLNSRTVFLCGGLCSCNLLTKTTFVLALFFYRA
jgi:hypothetical protein